MEEQEFIKLADGAIQALYRRLSAACEDLDFAPQLRAGALAIEFAAPAATFVVSPNPPVRQLWISANSKSFKLDWDWVQNTFVLAASGQTLAEVVSDAISRQLGEDVIL